MCLTEKAYQERKWGSFPTLRKALEDKKIPGHYFGMTSADDNMFDAMGRLLDIAVLFDEFKGYVKETANSLGVEKMCEDLKTLENALERARGFFEGSIRNVRMVARSIRD